MTEAANTGASSEVPSLALEHGLTGMAVVIGSRNDIETTLPLSPAEDFLATDSQRSHLARLGLEAVSLDPEIGSAVTDISGNFDILRRQIVQRTGVNDAAASLILFARM